MLYAWRVHGGSASADADAMQRPPVTVVVLVSEERPESLETCLQALHPTLWVHDETLVVAAGADPLASGSGMQFPWARSVRVPLATTAADAVNRAVEVARHDYVVLLRSDIVVVPEWLTRLLAPLRDSVVAAAAPRCDAPVVLEPARPHESGPTSLNELLAQSLDWHWQHVGERTDRQTLDAFCLALRVDAWRSVSGFDAATDRPGVELTAFWPRLLEAGWTLLSVDDTFVHRATADSIFADDVVLGGFVTAILFTIGNCSSAGISARRPPAPATARWLEP